MQSSNLRRILTALVIFLCACGAVLALSGNAVVFSIYLLSLLVACLAVAVMYIPSGIVDELKTELNEVRESLERIDLSARGREAVFNRKLITLEAELDERMISLESQIQDLSLLERDMDTEEDSRRRSYAFTALFILFLTVVVGALGAYPFFEASLQHENVAEKYARIQRMEEQSRGMLSEQEAQRSFLAAFFSPDRNLVE